MDHWTTTIYGQCKKLMDGIAVNPIIATCYLIPELPNVNVHS